ncbi:MAG: hypothetical protein EBZ74_00255 [Planctomycetia bacterium]|nr:hypothetical protein [Planctomycetia bacterium]
MPAEQSGSSQQLSQHDRWWCRRLFALRMAARRSAIGVHFFRTPQHEAAPQPGSQQPLPASHDLFGGLKGLFEKCKRKHHGCCDSCCGEPDCGAEPACGAGNGCAEPACGAGNGCAEPACGAGNGCCEPSCGAASCCGTRKKCTPIADLLRAIHNAKKRHHRSCCDSCCGEPDCSAGNGCCEPACGAVAAPVAAPAAPTPDASAAKKTTGKVVAVSRTVATK